ncbi:hypothetical protein pb186bvf_003005 [Paramecium bursaria]
MLFYYFLKNNLQNFPKKKFLNFCNQSLKSIFQIICNYTQIIFVMLQASFQFEIQQSIYNHILFIFLNIQDYQINRKLEKFGKDYKNQKEIVIKQK